MTLTACHANFEIAFLLFILSQKFFKVTFTVSKGSVLLIAPSLAIGCLFSLLSVGICESVIIK